MKFRTYLFLFLLFFVFIPNAFSVVEPLPFPIFKLEAEPLVRIGLIRNSSTALISTSESSLTASEDGQFNRVLDTNSLRVSARGYSPPVFEIYRIEKSGIETREQAVSIAAAIQVKLNIFSTLSADSDGVKFIIRLNEEFDVRPEADAQVQRLAEIGVEGAEVTVDKYTSPSDEAIALTRQISSNPKSKVRSLMSSPPTGGVTLPGLVKTIGSSQPIGRKNRGAYFNPSLREVVTSGSGPQSNSSSLRPIIIGSESNRGIVKLNGKSYRGKMEVFVNASGGVTVVNVVPMEDYLLGVVPAELSLPQIEAQKAQAVAARTYAIANKNGYGNEGFDMLPTVWSQVYKGVSIETGMGSQAVRETRGVVATYRGTPINALYTSTCGGRTEDSGNIFEFNEPYLKGVDCSLEGHDHFVPFLVKSSREPALIRNEANYPYVRLASKFAVNNFLMITNRFDDEYFEDAPNELELKSWLNNIAVKFGKPFPIVDQNSAKPLHLARILYQIIYTPNSAEDADTLMSESDLNYQLSFLDAKDVPRQDRPMLAELMRDGWFSIYSDLTIKPNKSYPRAKILRLIENIYRKKKIELSFEDGIAKPTEDAKLIISAGRSERQITVNPNVFLFRKFGDEYYQVKEAALVGGENIRYKTNGSGEVVYLEIDPIDKTTVAERMSSFTLWRSNLSASTVRARLARYVKGMGALIDVKVKTKGFSRRATELEIITTNGVQSLKGGKIRSALRLNEQLFVIDKKYGSDGRVVSYNFTGRGWGHGVGMCQYGAYGFAQMGLKYDRIIKHYYTGVNLTKAY